MNPEGRPLTALQATTVSPSKNKFSASMREGYAGENPFKETSPFIELVSDMDTTWDFALARYNPDGLLDTTFGTGGKVTTEVGAFDVLRLGRRSCSARYQQSDRCERADHEGSDFFAV